MNWTMDTDTPATGCGQPVESYTTPFHRLPTTGLDNSAASPSSYPQPFGQLCGFACEFPTVTTARSAADKVKNEKGKSVTYVLRQKCYLCAG